MKLNLLVVTKTAVVVVVAFFAFICSSSRGDNSSFSEAVVVVQSLNRLGATVTPHFKTVTGNRKPTPPTDAPLPNPKTIAECNKQWSAFFSGKKAAEKEIACCIQRKTCECIAVLCKDPSMEEECKDTYHPESCTKDCDQGNWSMEECMALPNESRSLISGLNWLWMLVIIAALMIVLVCVTICCVFRKKFTGRESRQDKEHGKISFGPMNVQSKVKWTGKSSKSKSRQQQQQSSKKSTSKKTSSKKTSTSAKKKKTGGSSGKDGGGGGSGQPQQKVGVIGGHAGKMTTTMKKRATMSDGKLLAQMKR